MSKLEKVLEYVIELQLTGWYGMSPEKGDGYIEGLEKVEKFLKDLVSEKKHQKSQIIKDDNKSNNNAYRNR